MPGGGAVIRSRLSIRDLENALAQALEERDAQAVEVEAELGTLSRIYERLRNDYEQLREERDRAIDEARLERERRAKETLELAERLVAAAAEDDARPVDADALRERFVTERKTSPRPEIFAYDQDSALATIDELRAAKGMGPHPRREIGMLTVPEFKAELEARKLAAAAGASKPTPPPAPPAPPPEP